METIGTNGTGRRSLGALLLEVARDHEVGVNQISNGLKDMKTCEARGDFALRAHQAGYDYAKIAKFAGVVPSAVRMQVIKRTKGNTPTLALAPREENATTARPEATIPDYGFKYSEVRELREKILTLSSWVVWTSIMTGFILTLQLVQILH